ncbi:MAG: nitroreductase [Promethearchaeota archaeon]|nr:MAG: nitroreductase [Candidatus Lokiarchaeota archaeon]
MNFSTSIIETIKKRTSWRTYSPEPIQGLKREEIDHFIKLKDISTPFGINPSDYRFRILSIPEFDPKEKKKIGTYGVIQGAQDFIVGAIKSSELDQEHYGYLMELIILKATELELGTCWLGGFFNRSLFGEKINCTPYEVVPAITPIGYPKDRRAKEKFIRFIVKAKKRKPWEEIFFSGNLENSLSNIDLGKYSVLLEMIRLGPSAANRQPWRIIKENNDSIFHFYIAPQKGRMGQIYETMTRLDIGIAVCHFDLCAKELGIIGKWKVENPEIQGTEEYSYTISWFGS